MSKNIFANVLGKTWSIVSIFIFIPLYIKFLGIDLYGLVSLFATIQGVLFLLDAGLSATLRREFSVGENTTKNKLNKYKLFRSIEFCYLLIFFLIINLCFFGAETIVHNWLNLENIDSSIAITTIRLMGGSIGLQFLSTLYNGGLLGLEKQVKVNLAQVLYSILKNGCVILLLWLVKADIRLFYLWFIFVDILYVVFLRIFLVNSLGIRGFYSWSFYELNNLKTVWKYAIGVLTISFISAVNFQLDKILISKYLLISELGIYNLSFSLAQLPVIFLNSISLAIFPRLVSFYSLNETVKLKKLFLRSYKVLGIISISVSVFICFFSRDLLFLWTKDLEISSKAFLSTSILVIGSMFLSLQVIPFNLALSHSTTKINTFFGILNIIMVVPMLMYMVPKYGIEGAAITWLFILFIITPFYNCYVYSKFIGKNWAKWFLKDSILPLFSVTIIAVLFYFLKLKLNLGGVSAIMYSVITGCFTLLITLYIYEKRFIVGYLNKVKRISAKN